MPVLPLFTPASRLVGLPTPPTSQSPISGTAESTAGESARLRQTEASKLHNEMMKVFKSGDHMKEVGEKKREALLNIEEHREVGGKRKRKKLRLEG